MSTPPAVVALFWSLLKDQHASQFARVLDVGAGDCRFARDGHYAQYDAVELDPKKAKSAQLPQNGRMFYGCAFGLSQAGYNACIGNPPYVRHHDIETPWRKKTAASINEALDIQLNGNGNLYLYFLCLGLMKTQADGLVAMVVPFEWVSRPSAKSIREYIRKEKWNVKIYRFNESIFADVLTTASITIIDKSKKDSEWTFFDVNKDLSISSRRGISGSEATILEHARRGRVWARRGISPGGQKIFTLTNAERLNAGLRRSDVVPCVTSLRFLPHHVMKLDEATFEEYFVKAGLRCWLVKSAGARIPARVANYLRHIPISERDTYACRNQKPWHRYESSPSPRILFHSGFMKRSPKVVINSIQAQAVGSMYGVHADRPMPTKALRAYLAQYDFESRIVAHARTLRKVEVGQLNSVLAGWLKKRTNERAAAR